MDKVTQEDKEFFEAIVKTGDLDNALKFAFTLGEINTLKDQLNNHESEE